MNPYDIERLQEDVPFATESSQHGDPVRCPTCASYGHFDDMKHTDESGTAIFTDAIWLSVDKSWKEKFGNFECHDCWLK